MSRVMVSCVQPLSSEGLYTFVLQPYLEGIERLKRAWEGVDFHSLSGTAYNWKKRIVFLVVGICLTFFPLINNIFWIVWQTFGHPEFLSDPFTALQSSLEPLPSLPKTAIVETPAIKKAAAVRMAAAPKTETFAYNESSKHFHVEAKWKLETFPHMVQVQVDSERERTVARYNREGQIQEYHCSGVNGDLHAVLCGKNKIQIDATRGQRIEKREHLLTRDIPWVQQSTLGLKQFILNPEQKTFRFYSVRPDNLDLVEVVAQKLGEEEIPGYGKLIHVEMKMDHYLYRYLREGEMWYDPKTGILRKLVDSGRFMDTVVTEYQELESIAAK